MNLFYEITNDIFAELSDKICDYEGDIDVEIEDGEYLICFEGRYELYTEADNGYYNGTGSNRATYVYISLNCTVYDEYGYVVDNNYSNEKFEDFLYYLYR